MGELSVKRGFIGNNAGNGDAVRALCADFVMCSFHALLWNQEYDFGGTQFVTALCYTDQYAPWTVENFKLAAAHPMNSHIYFGGYNEADLARITVAQHVVAIQRQMDLVLAADEKAQFVVGHLSHTEPIFETGGHFDLLWQVLKIVDAQHLYRQRIIGFSQHVYPPANLRVFLKQLSEWRAERFPHRSLWLGEIGRSVPNPEAEYAPAHVAALCEKFGIENFVWFSQILMPTAPMDALQSSTGANTPTGAEFASLRMRT